MSWQAWLRRFSALGIDPAQAGAAPAAAAAPAPAPPAGQPEPLHLPDDEWRRRLGRAQYAVLRRQATEPPHDSALNGERRAGTYHCAGCDWPLFSSDAKVDSGSGWPSFHTALPGALGTRPDYTMFMQRTEYHCARCGGHQGHVFDDGPHPSGKRYCNNGLALRFAAAQA